MTREVSSLSCVVCVAAVFACAREPRQLAATAEFGIVYGGQIQQRTEIPFQLDAAKQTQAFRITLEHPAPKELSVAWEVSRPASRGRKASTRLFEGKLAAGQKRFEQRLEFAPGDPLGVWNLRVVLSSPDGDATVLVDRPFSVYDDAERRRKLQKLADGGL